MAGNRCAQGQAVTADGNRHQFRDSLQVDDSVQCKAPFLKLSNQVRTPAQRSGPSAPGSQCRDSLVHTSWCYKIKCLQRTTSSMGSVIGVSVRGTLIEVRYG